MEIVAGKNESLYKRVLSGGRQRAGLLEERVLYTNTWWCTGASANSVRLNDFEKMTQASLCTSGFQRGELSVC